MSAVMDHLQGSSRCTWRRRMSCVSGLPGNVSPTNYSPTASPTGHLCRLVFDPLPHIARFGSEAECWTMLFDVFATVSRRHGLPVGWMTGIDRVARDQQAA